mmetsp:Transcript_19139/g.48761  ORF Transcript_19139/g.48761 Transcript_19139/m.48761 type:complete len:223 (+) Transcript_19139:171-839(+)
MPAPGLLRPGRPRTRDTRETVCSLRVPQTAAGSHASVLDVLLVDGAVEVPLVDEVLHHLAHCLLGVLPGEALHDEGDGDALLRVAGVRHHLDDLVIQLAATRSLLLLLHRRGAWPRATGGRHGGGGLAAEGPGALGLLEVHVNGLEQVIAQLVRLVQRADGKGGHTLRALEGAQQTDAANVDALLELVALVDGGLGLVIVRPDLDVEEAGAVVKAVGDPVGL